jgi:3-hydroxyisobutyrate dehydrogenase-like beta-hydroxyacid dehydrogenase
MGPRPDEPGRRESGMATGKERTLGFIGAGNQGGPLAMRLVQAGHHLTVFDLNPKVQEEFKAAGATVVDSAAAVGAACDFVEVCVVDDVGVKEVVAGLLQTMKPGGIIAIHSTVLPTTVQSLAEQAAGQGVSLIDAAVTGGEARARTGEMVVMLGGDDATVAVCREIFPAFATMIVHLGSVGAGQKAKAINNAIMCANFVLAHEAYEVGEALGLDKDALAQVICNGSAASFSMDVRTGLPSIKAFEYGAFLLKKDVGILRESCDAAPAKQILAVADRLQGYVHG